jgi:succinate dehydrogenase/fumarate reductase-like Fe-S protein
MTINGAVAKACSTLIRPGEEILVEPVFKYPVIRDLVTDFGTTVTTKDGVFTLGRGVSVAKGTTE